MAIYEFAAKCINVVDGDTVDLEIDLGFKMTTVQRIRLSGIDTPEIRGGSDESKAKAQKAKARVQGLLIDNVNEFFGKYPLLVHTEKADSFGRYLGEVKAFIEFVDEDGGRHPQHWASVNEILLEEGLAVPYKK